MRLAALLFVFSLVATGNIWAEERDINVEAERFSQMYFARMDGANFFRLYDPLSGMVEFSRNWGTGSLNGAAGWRAEEAGETVRIQPPDATVMFSFVKGRPDMMSMQGKKVKLQFDEEPSICGGIAAMWEGAEEEALAFHAKKWPGRYAPFYGNPNHSAMLFALIGIVSLWVFLRFDRLWAMAASASVAALATWLLVKTGGRAGFLALAVGGVAVYGFRFFRRGAKMRLCLLGAFALAAIIFFAAGRNLGRISIHTGDVGNVARMETWKAVPQMMVDAPMGWGDTQPGRAYSDWYQPLTSMYVTPTLTSDHLTYMTGFGWMGRFLWAFAWFALLGVLARFPTRGESALPFALFLALGTAAIFNPLLHVKTLWLIPLVALCPFALSRPWREARKMIAPCVLAASLSLTLVAAFWGCGSGAPAARKPSIHTDGERVFVGKADPKVWIVDDRYTLGWLSAPKEIRYFYSHFPAAGALGYVESIAAVPRRVHRLVVAGRRCREYIKAWKKGEAPKATELVFVSPEMPISSVPAGLRACCKFKMVVGDFAARYVDVYGKLEPSDEVVLIEGAESYIPGWVGMVLTQL